MTALAAPRQPNAAGAALVILGVAVLLRVTDVFVLRTDEWLGEQWLTKGLGFGIVVLYLRLRDGGLGDIGLHRRRWRRAMALGAALTVVALAVGYGAEYAVLTVLGHSPGFVIAFEDHALVPDTGATGGLVFGLTLLGGNLLNSFMEESLFRGLLITQLRGAMSARRANATQAILFGLWHVVWPIRSAMDGAMTVEIAIVAACVYVAASGLVGYAWGLLFLWTGSLWTPWSAHTVNNSVLNLLHVYTPAGEAPTLGLRVGLATVVLILSLPLVRRWVVVEREAGAPQTRREEGNVSQTPDRGGSDQRACGPEFSPPEVERVPHRHRPVRHFILRLEPAPLHSRYRCERACTDPHQTQPARLAARGDPTPADL